MPRSKRTIKTKKEKEKTISWISSKKNKNKNLYFIIIIIIIIIILATYLKNNVEKEIPRIFLNFGRIFVSIDHLKKGTWF